MEQSQRFKSKTRLDYGCKLKKAVYGLKKSPRAWYDKIAEFLLQVGYWSIAPIDSSLFIKDKNGKL